MKAITAPIDINSVGEVIANLHDALQMCLDRGGYLGNEPNARQTLSRNVQTRTRKED